MTLRTTAVRLFVLACAALVVGCGETGATPATGEASAGDLQPLPTEACQAMAAELGGALGAEPEVAQAPWPQDADGASGTGCAITFMGTGADFGSLPEVSDALRSTLETEGWTEDPASAADGPTGTSFRVTMGSEVGVVSAGWEPSSDADCPEDQPIAACELAPEQQLYTIQASFAETG